MNTFDETFNTNKYLKEIEERKKERKKEIRLAILEARALLQEKEIKEERQELFNRQTGEYTNEEIEFIVEVNKLRITIAQLENDLKNMK